ncbi:ribonuclease HI [Sulfuricurvum sp. RIFCSPLOWO2_12_FULL_43_24]|uniref:ribonuclease HI n=1 Tax=Sulfuricurvum sp. RIFCSPLOWO2_12_FULL_43_24 TaxID=1802247 RepID=UPI0008C9F476|nr:ribonuclease HI [Sulfuricurvum sp. RIFCSPLOWO2_12_FULL_43_24]OHD85855.1 MAG: ribonuclease HI [Sulfuricurvum sp. RIFCSPLOWO2_02_FULL_43_45]OHD86495.1 MAG: ribonuclease HI [Sulfuricurvum sp. RIFCSPLOWO2_02_43_6]OHD89557.1 MAG: ribonuclease HI [Sulfuricurvum sp. RIFCSPLOWO2_12_FULL_43_24]OHD91959.1 MAG: ribonuclease HI [Sulfuricurvum sp. RIFCSPLOWO2_12_43_5]
MKKITLFSDGSALGNPGPGGFGAILRYGDKERIISGGEEHTTNNRMELLGVIEGLRAIKEPCDVTVISDSSYVIRGINEWLEGWIKRNFAKVKNPDLWQEYIKVSRGHRINGVWVRGHNGHPENEQCDQIAREEAEKYKNTLK